MIFELLLEILHLLLLFLVLEMVHYGGLCATERLEDVLINFDLVTILEVREICLSGYPIQIDALGHVFELWPEMRWQILDLRVDEVRPLILFAIDDLLQLVHIVFESFLESNSSLHFNQRLVVGLRQN